MCLPQYIEVDDGYGPKERSVLAWKPLSAGILIAQRLHFACIKSYENMKQCYQ